MSKNLLQSLTKNVIQELGEEHLQDESLEDSKELAKYEEELGRNSLTLSNTQHFGATNFRSGEHAEDQDDDFRNTLSVSGRETEGQNLILIKSKEMIEKLRYQLLQSETQNLTLQEQILEMSKQIEALKQSKFDIQKQMVEEDEIVKTMELMRSKVDEF